MGSKKCSFFLVGRPLAPPPLSGRANKKQTFFAASLYTVTAEFTIDFQFTKVSPSIKHIEFNLLQVMLSIMHFHHEVNTIIFIELL